MRLFLFVLLFLPGTAHADLSFVQAVQAQTAGGEDGLFGKSWVEVKGERMRLVSAYARRLKPGGEAQEPRRSIQLFDLRSPERILVYPEEKAYARAPLAEIDYGHGLEDALRRGEERYSVSLSTIIVQPGSLLRKLLGVECRHYRLRAQLTLSPSGTAGSGAAPAELVQDVWLASLTGEVSRSVLDLMAFETAYGKATGDRLSPIDHERYQTREAAAYLRVPEEDLRRAAAALRQRLRDLPGYALASSVSWIRPESGASSHADQPAGPREAPASKPARPRRRLRWMLPRTPVGTGLSAGKPKLQPVPWLNSERRINRIFRDTQSAFIPSVRGARPIPDAAVPGPLVRAVEQEISPRFEQELRRLLVALIQEQDHLRAAAQAPPHSPPGKPFLEIYAELHGLEVPAQVPESDLSVPQGFQQIEYRSGK